MKKGFLLTLLSFLALVIGVLFGVQYLNTKEEMWFNLTIACIIASGLLSSVHVLKNKNAKFWTVVVDWVTVSFALVAGWKYYTTRSDMWLWIMVASLVTLVTWWAVFGYMKWSEFRERREMTNWYNNVFGGRPSTTSHAWTEALRTNDWETIRALWRLEQDNSRRQDTTREFSLLRLAVRADNPEAVQFVLENGADVNEHGEHGFMMTPIYLAKSSRPNFQKVMNALIQAGADVNYRLPGSGTTPLMHAILSEDEDKVKMLLENGADPLLTNDLGENAMFAVAKSKTDNILEMLETLAPLVPVDSIDSEGRTPLHTAARYHNLDNIESLLNHGANVNHTDWNGDTALTHAVQSFLKIWGNVREEEADVLAEMDVMDDREFQQNLESRTRQQDKLISDILTTVDLLLQHGAHIKRPNREGKFEVLERIRGLFPLKSEDEYKRDVNDTENELVRDVKEQSRIRELAAYGKWVELIDRVEKMITQHLQTETRRAHTVAEMIQENIVGMPADVIGEEIGQYKEEESADTFRSRRGVSANIAEFLVGPYLSTKHEFGRKGSRKGKNQNKVWKYPRKWSEEFCKKTKCSDMGFSQKASCRPYKNCYKK